MGRPSTTECTYLPTSRSRLSRRWHCWCLRRRLRVGVLLLCVHTRPSCSGQSSARWVYGTGLLPARRDCLPLATRNFQKSSLNSLLCLSCCLLLV